MVKTYVLDTNVILYDADSIFRFAEHKVVIPITVIEEVDTFKKNMDERGRNARRFARYLDDLRAINNLVAGVPLNEEGGRLYVILHHQIPGTTDLSMDYSIPDNRILGSARTLTTVGDRAILVTKDVNLRVKADAFGVSAEDFDNSKVPIDELYSGFQQVCLDDAKFDIFCQGGGLPIEPGSFLPNEYVLLTCAKYPEKIVPTRYCQLSNELREIDSDPVAWGLSPRNMEQHLALDLLLNDDIKLVTLVGKAGTGKTLMAIAAGLNRVAEDFKYTKMLVSRPVFPMGKDIGFLPGDLEEKLNPWMQPIYDNVEFLLGGYSSPAPKLPKAKKRSVKEGVGQPAEDKDKGRYSDCHKELVALGIMQIEPLMYIRGRSIPKQYMIVDEAQNLSPHEVKTIITRSGEGTKIILTGDPYQIDNPYVDSSSNGLTYAVERFKDQAIAGHITLTKGERSELAEIASNVL